MNSSINQNHSEIQADMKVYVSQADSINLVLHENMITWVENFFIVRMEARNNHFPRNLCIVQYFGLIFVLLGRKRSILYTASVELPPFIAIIIYS